jgi:hypothetical protein
MTANTTNTDPANPRQDLSLHDPRSPYGNPNHVPARDVVIETSAERLEITEARQMPGALFKNGLAER